MFRTSPENTKIYQALFEIRNAVIDEGLKKTKNNPAYRSKYMDLESLMDTLNPILQEKRVLLLQPISSTEDGKMSLITRFVHLDSGEFVETETLWLSFGADIQKTGGANTYGRRYDIVSLLALIAESDDDGNSVVGKGPVQVQPISEKGKAFVGGGLKKPAA